MSDTRKGHLPDDGEQPRRKKRRHSRRGIRRRKAIAVRAVPPPVKRTMKHKPLPHSNALHVVTPNEGGWFDVKSGRSGKFYKVTTAPICYKVSDVKSPKPELCNGFAARGSCSHVDAVNVYASRVLQKLKQP